MNHNFWAIMGLGNIVAPFLVFAIKLIAKRTDKNNNDGRYDMTVKNLLWSIGLSWFSVAFAIYELLQDRGFFDKKIWRF